MTMRAYLPCSMLLLLTGACPGAEPGDETTTSTSTNDTGSGSGSASATSTSTASTSAGEASGDGDSTTGPASPCVDPSHEYFMPGCDPSPAEVTVAAGCYLPCNDDTPCGEDQCVTVWVDPCFDQPCEACGSQQGLCLSGLPTGAECTADQECSTGVCWDFNDYDECCFGTMCSGLCIESGECVTLAMEANAPMPEQAMCLPDGRCDLSSTGLPVSLACAGPPCG